MNKTKTARLYRYEENHVFVYDPYTPFGEQVPLLVASISHGLFFAPINNDLNDLVAMMVYRVVGSNGGRYPLWGRVIKNVLEPLQIPPFIQGVTERRNFFDGYTLHLPDLVIFPVYRHKQVIYVAVTDYVTYKHYQIANTGK